MSSTLPSRIAVIVALLAVPLLLAIGSQTIASRPGAPAVPTQVVSINVPPVAPGDPAPTRPGPSARPVEPGPAPVQTHPVPQFDDSEADLDD